MWICSGAVLLPWLLSCFGTCNGHQALNEVNYSFKTSAVSGRNDPTLHEDEVGHYSNSSPESSQLLPPGKDMLECDMPWFSGDNILPRIVFKCGKNNSLSVAFGYCATTDESGTLEVGRCIYNYNTHDSLRSDVPKSKTMLNYVMCKGQQLHRTGTLCGKCQDGYYPLAYSFDLNCVQCPNGKSNWWKFVLAAFLPLTIFHIIILFFKINVISSRFQGFLFYSQMISMPAMTRFVIFLGKYKTNDKNNAAQIAIRCLATFYGIWNLDFFRSMKFGICLGTDTLQVLALDLLVGIYPILLMIFSFILIELHERDFRPLVIIWKPFRRMFVLFREKWDLRTSLIDAFATTFLLSNVKFQSVSFDLLTPVIVYQLNDSGNWNHSLRLFYDATVPYFGSRHLPYGIVGLVVVMIFAVLPVLLLFLYPFHFFQKLLNLFPARWYVLHTFVDAFHGSYKDGTQPGTRDCRWFASLFILSRFCIMFIGAYTKNSMMFPISAMIITVIALLFATAQPFKENVSHFTTINTFFVLLMAMWYTLIVGFTESVSKGKTLLPVYFTIVIIISILPLLYISVIIVHWMCSQRMFGTDVIRKFRAWRSGYKIL